MHPYIDDFPMQPVYLYRQVSAFYNQASPGQRMRNFYYLFFLTNIQTGYLYMTLYICIY